MVIPYSLVKIVGAPQEFNLAPIWPSKCLYLTPTPSRPVGPSGVEMEDGTPAPSPAGTLDGSTFSDDADGIDAYAELKELGRGSFGTATLVRRRRDDRLLVLKRVHAGGGEREGGQGGQDRGRDTSKAGTP